VPRAAKRAIDLLALAVTLVAGYLYLDELGKLWLFWTLAGVVIVAVAAWYGRRKLRRFLRRLR
jgi:hypothetical protein